MGNFFRGDSALQEWYKRKQAEKYGSYFGGGGSTSSSSPSSGSGAGSQGNTEPDIEREPVQKDPPVTRYWDSKGPNSASRQFTQSLNTMDRSNTPSVGAGEGLGLTPNTERPTTATTRGTPGSTPAERLGLYVGGNEGRLPQLSFGKKPPEGFYDAPPRWVTDNSQYTATLNRLGTVRRREDSELDTFSRGDQGLQETLTASGYDTGGVDGFWGSKTDAALRQFKVDNGLGDNTELDHTTREALKKTVIEIKRWAGRVENDPDIRNAPRE